VINVTEFLILNNPFLKAKMKYTIIVSIIIGATYLMSCRKSPAQDTFPKDSFLVDVRTAEEFQSGSVANAINIPLNEIESNLDKFSGKEHIVVFCRSGNRSNKAKKKLEENGISNVTNGGSLQDVKSSISTQ